MTMTEKLIPQSEANAMVAAAYAVGFEAALAAYAVGFEAAFNEDEYLGWACFRGGRDGDRPTTVHLCASDAPGAFKVWRKRPTPADAVKELAEREKALLDGVISGRDYLLKQANDNIAKLEADNAALREQITSAERRGRLEEAKEWEPYVDRDQFPTFAQERIAALESAQPPQLTAEAGQARPRGE